MKKLLFFLAIVAGMQFMIVSCENDDDTGTITPPRDRAEEAAAAEAEIMEYLETHFYNYEEFENPTEDFDFRLVFDTIAGDNASKTRLIDQVTSKIVQDRQDEDVTYNLYYLKAVQGEGDSPRFPDLTTLSYEGRAMDDYFLFDASEVPVQFDLTGTINGFQDGLIEFNGAGETNTNPDGTVSFENFGVGAVFVPSGLGYYNQPPPDIDQYQQIMFLFQVYAAETADQDLDGIPSYLEDINDNGLEEDDDTDGDFLPNLFDNDDDNDGRLTIDEIIINDDGTITFPDEDNDGTPDYLDSDS